MTEPRARFEWLAEAASASCEHHWISSHQGDFPEPIYWVDQCSLCGTFNAARLTEQVAPLLDALSAALAAKEAAEARAKALQGKTDRCVTHIREGQQLRPDEPDAGLEALVVGWVNYHGDCCNFKARAERAEARVRKAQWYLDRQGDRYPMPELRAALAAAAPSEPQETTP